MNNQENRAERGKTQIEVTVATRQNLRLLAALTGVSMAAAAGEAIARRLAEASRESREGSQL